MRFPQRPRLFPALGLGFVLSYASATPILAQQRDPATGNRTTPGSPGSIAPFRTQSLPNAPSNPYLTRPEDIRPGPIDVQRPIAGTSTVSENLFLDARSINDPGERALAFIRIATTAIFSRQFEEAHTALFEAGPAALAERNGLIREQRLTAIIDTLINLAEQRMSDISDVDLAALSTTTTTTPAPPPAAAPGDAGKSTPGAPRQTPPPDPIPAPAVSSASTPVSADRMKRLKAALPEWAQAVDLARRLERVTARTEALYRIVESEAFSSQKLVTEKFKQSGERPEPSKLDPPYREFTDYLMTASAYHAGMIERPIWRNFACYTIVTNAAASSQFKQGFQIARAIEQPEARTDALIRLAEGQAINGRPNEATAAYEEAARSVALIPQEDPRETLIGVLIDSLISYGRFDDARACVPLYSFPSRQLTALEAVAESQGRRNLAANAREWIANENPAFRPALYRKVNDGILAAIERDRSKDLMNGAK